MTPFPPGERRRPPIELLISAAWIIPALLGALNAYAQSGRGPDAWRYVVWEGGDWLLYAGLTPIVLVLARRFPLRRGALARRLPLHLGAALTLCFAWAGAGTLLHTALLPADNWLNWGAVAGWTLTTFPFGVSVYFALVGIEHALHFYLQAQERATRLAEARLAALRMQMQPHFLLNSLNAITVLVRDRDTAAATGMLERLGDLLRRVMRSDRPPEVPLADELDFLRQYLAIEEVRFPDRLRPAFDVPPAVLRAAVPEFVLQPLVENAIRHGLAQRETATLLRIAARREGADLVLTVTDDGPGPAPATGDDGTGLGLRNTRERLATLYGERARLELRRSPGGGTVATVRLPYRDLGGGEAPRA